ncbi:Protein of unknown function [Gryllus bimaculatus]|nr:Protein of unknown function [Gryllus bimaculatus]
MNFVLPYNVPASFPDYFANSSAAYSGVTSGLKWLFRHTDSEPDSPRPHEQAGSDRATGRVKDSDSGSSSTTLSLDQEAAKLLPPPAQAPSGHSNAAQQGAIPKQPRGLSSFSSSGRRRRRWGGWPPPALLRCAAPSPAPRPPPPFARRRPPPPPPRRLAAPAPQRAAGLGAPAAAAASTLLRQRFWRYGAPRPRPAPATPSARPHHRARRDGPRPRPAAAGAEGSWAAAWAMRRGLPAAPLLRPQTGPAALTRNPRARTGQTASSRRRARRRWKLSGFITLPEAQR